QDAAQVKEVAQPSLAPGEAAQGNSTPVPQTMAVEKVPQFPFARGDAEQMSLSPVLETQRFEEIPQSSLASGDAERTSLPPLRDTSQAGEVPPPPVTPDDVDPDKELVPARFLDFYGLREQPFGVTPDPAYLYLGPAHREAWRSLWNGIQNDRGFMALIAEPGMGKTTLLNKLLGELRDSARTVFLFQTKFDSREFFRPLLMELGVSTHLM